MNNKTSSGSSGTGFIGLLTIVFITLKLIEKINWPWIWVLSPIWITAVLIVLLAIILALTD